MARSRPYPTTRALLWRGLRWTAVIFGILAFVWVAGLVWFAAMMPRSVADTKSRTDAIVVLTGGSGRLEEGIRLLKQGYAPVLFLSGVNRKVVKADILRLTGEGDPGLAKRIVLGYRAEHTAGNAVETAMWATGQRLRSLRLVTANYHMPRSRLELEHALPGVTLVSNPVFPRIVAPDRWWRTERGLRTVVGEYNKYLAALLRISFASDLLGEPLQWS